LLVGIGVDLGEGHLVAVSSGDFLDDGGQLFAWGAPVGPVIDENRFGCSRNLGTEGASVTSMTWLMNDLSRGKRGCP